MRSVIQSDPDRTTPDDVVDFTRLDRLLAVFKSAGLNRTFVNMSKEIIRECERLELYLEIVELDRDILSWHLNRERERVDKLECYIAMLHYYLNTGKGAEFLNDIHIERVMANRPEAFRLFQQAYNYGS